ncbi:MAG: hypothetical protein JSV31_22435 [Desulfobacterales bacterium]|nr:MAG: hypothetical protein JSV31_22435 [Desulfobacterales bacterium]
MPARKRQNPNTGKWTVSTPGGVKGRGMTLRNANRQIRLLNAVEHGWKPTGAPARDKLKKNKGRKHG